MNKFAKLFGVSLCVFGFVVLQGCATKINASSTQNPLPKEAFSGFSRIELKAVVFKQGVVGDMAGLAKIDENLKKQLREALPKWNAVPDNGRRLVIEPVIEEMSFKHGASRVLLGPLVGGSGVLMRLNIRDGNGQEIATPEFFNRSGAWSGGLTMGINDNLMLTRVAELAGNYVMANYDRVRGGSTGAGDKTVQPK